MRGELRVVNRNVLSPLGWLRADKCSKVVRCQEVDVLWGRVGRDREDKRLVQRTKVLLGKSALAPARELAGYGAGVT